MKTLLSTIVCLLALVGCSEDKKGDDRAAIVALANEVTTYAPKRDQFANDFEFAKALTNFVHVSSVHDARPRPSEWGYLNTKLYLTVMLSYFKGEGELPYLQCGDRSSVLIELFKAQGIDARLLNFEGTDSLGHVVMDWFYAAENKYVLADPDYNVLYVKHSNGSPLSLAEIIHLDWTADYEPIGGAAGAGQGWLYTNKDGVSVETLRSSNFLSAGIYWTNNDGEVNPARARAGWQAWPKFRTRNVRTSL